MKKKIIRITTVPESLGGLLTGQLKFISMFFEVVGISSTGKDSMLSKVGENEKIRVIPVEMTRKITPIKDLKAVWALYKIFKKERPYIVHSHTPKAGTLGMTAAYLAKVPNRMHTIAGLPLIEAKGIKRLLLNIVEKLTYRLSTKIYPNSHGLVDIILENKFTKKEKLKVLANGSSNGIDTIYFHPNKFSEAKKNALRKQLRLKKDDFIFIFVGRLVKDKGINELVNVFDELCTEMESIKLLLVGNFETELDPLLPSTMRVIKSNKNIIGTGWADDVRPYFSISNVLTFPSYREGFPNVVMQAGAMKLPSIVTDINGCNEIVIHNETGLIIPAKDERGLKISMKKILNDKQKAEEMGEKSRVKIVNSYEQKKVWEAILEEYNTL